MTRSQMSYENVIKGLRISTGERFETTFVSAYVKIKSKHSTNEYDLWMANFLALNDPVIIYTTPDLFETIKSKRTNGAPLTLFSINTVSTYDEKYWSNQHRIDPEKHIHKNPMLYYIWSLKTKLLYESTRTNPYKSNYFVWSDIGCYRNNEYNGQSQLATVPYLGVDHLFVNIHPYDSDDYFFNTCDGKTQCRRIAAAQFMCRLDRCKDLYSWYQEAVEEYQGRFVGNDQNILGTMCLKRQCNVFTPNGQYGDVWFGMQPVMAKKYTPEIFSVQPYRKELNNRFNGRLGNQLFQLQAGLFFAEKNNMDYCLSQEFAYGDIVNVDHIPKCNFKFGKFVKEKHYGIFNDRLNFKHSRNTLDGYFQSWKYESTKINLKHPPPPKVNDVCVHVRVGDKSKQPWFNFPPDQYFIDTIGESSSVLIVTDDMKWCMNNPLFSQYKIVSDSVENDFLLLMSCNVIVSTRQSTFSWWAAKLSGAEFIYYHDEINLEHSVQKGHIKKEDYYIENAIAWKPTKKKKPLFMVMGVPHSGSSVLTGILELSGMNGGSMTHVDQYHPKGIFESKIINEHNDWLLNNMEKVSIGTMIEKTKNVLSQIDDIDIIKKPQLAETFSIWEKASDRPIVKLIAYRHPFDACNHPHCPNCGHNTCFENIISTLDNIDDTNSVIFDLNKFQKDYYGTYLKLLSEVDYDLNPLSKPKLLEFISERSDKEPHLSLGDHFDYGTVTEQLLKIHNKNALVTELSDDTTTVIGLWDLNRPDRTIDDYKEWLFKTIESTKHPVILFTDEEDVLKMYEQNERVYIVKAKLKNMPMFRKHFEKNKALHNDYKSSRVENLIPEYNVVQWVKFDAMRIAAQMNPFKSTNFMWIDAGISRFGNQFDLNNPDIKNIISDKFLISIHHHFNMDKSFNKICSNTTKYIREENSHLAGTILAASKKSIEVAYDDLDSFLYKTTDMNNDQVMLAALYCESDAFAIIQTKNYYHPGLDIQHVYNSQDEPFVIHKQKRAKFAISTMLVDADDKNYVRGSLKLAKSIKKHVNLDNIDLVLLELIERPLPRHVKKQLQSSGWLIKSINRIAPHDERNTFPRFRDQFSKLQLWGMTQYDRIVYLDSDTIVINDISELFALSMPDDISIVASRDIADGKWRKTFNMGMFMIKPNADEYMKLIKKKEKVKFETAMSEQGYLNVVYKDKWKDPGFEYNANLAAYSQIPAFWKDVESKIKVIHYTMEKPWACSKTYKAVCDIWRDL